ncbi:Flp pilus assembly protein TadG [Breoghania corrubedonensis]|uniref:Flp pilus assembly protein TadG n=1 Tax=Breoghania corrubedonensis TaxID=665038 RepID=A0A2T5VG15_9HYPH|nr:TadE/TadG family type IV pilus assembly protein [Breoghania corrubedonensis]PTW62704.1 Flp pilus assembly protein TadG [Breoghania corrubedonensis]
MKRAGPSVPASARRLSPARLVMRRVADLTRRGRRDETGATAIEFAMVAAPFFALILGITEIGLMFFAGRILDNATADAARLIRTGQAYSQSFDGAKFKTQIMDRLPGFFSADRLSIDVQTFTSFAGISLSDPIEKDKLKDADFSYVNAGASQIVVVRVFYRWPMMTSYLGVNFADLSDGSRLLGAVQAFRTEPFPETKNGGGSS